MTTKSIHDIEIKDDDFDNFLKKFEAYRQAAKKLPTGWKETEEVTDKTAEHFERMTAALLAQNDLLRERDRAETRDRDTQDRQDRKEKEKEKRERERLKEEQRATKDRAAKAKELAKDTEKVAGNMASATVSAAKWVTLGAVGIGAGLLGAGLFGLDRMASNVSDQRRAALGSNTTIGERRAFGVNFGQLLSPDLLDNTVAAQNDYARMWAFNAMGIRGARGMNPLDLQVQSMTRARDMFRNSDHSQQFAEAHGLLTTGYSMGDLRTLSNLSTDEFQKHIQAMRIDQGTLDIKDKTAGSWQLFISQMQRAGSQIENVFVRGLEPLEQPLENLSAQVAKAVKAFMESGQLKEWISDLSNGIKDFAKYLGTDDFKAQSRNFISTVGMLGDEVVAVAERLKWLIPDKTAPSVRIPKNDAELSQYRKDFFNPFVWDERASGTNAGPEINAAAKKYGVSAQTIHNIWGAESAFGHNAGPSIAGALGPFQLMPVTAKQYGVTNPMDFGQSLDAAGHLLSDLLKRYHGDMAKALAAYNDGPGHIDADIKMAAKNPGSSWMQYLPKETRNYLAKVDPDDIQAMAGLWAISRAVTGKPPGPAAPTKIDVTLHNSTSAQTAISLNQLAH